MASKIRLRSNWLARKALSSSTALLMAGMARHWGRKRCWRPDGTVKTSHKHLKTCAAFWILCPSSFFLRPETLSSARGSTAMEIHLRGVNRANTKKIERNDQQTVGRTGAFTFQKRRFDDLPRSMDTQIGNTQGAGRAKRAKNTTNTSIIQIS